MGGTSDNTYLYTMDVSSSGIVVAGISNDNGLISSGGWKPIMALYSSTGALQWVERVGDQSDSIHAVRWTTDANNIIAATSGSASASDDLTIFVLDSTGGHTFTWVTGDSGFIVLHQGMIVDSGTNVFLALMSDNNRWLVMGVDWYAGSIIFQKRTSTIYSQAYALQWYQSSYTDFIVSGTIVDSSSNYYQAITQISASSGLYNGYNFGYKFSSSIRLKPFELFVYYDGSYDYFYFGSLNHTDDNNAYFVMIKAASSSSFTSTTSLYHSSSGNGMYIYGSYVSSSNLNQFYTYLSYTLSNTFYFAKVDFSTKQITLKKLDYLSNLYNKMQAATFSSVTDSYYIVNAKYLKGSTESPFGDYIGVCMALSTSKSCMYQSQPSSTVSLTSFSLPSRTTLSVTLSDENLNLSDRSSATSNTNTRTAYLSTPYCYISNSVTLSGTLTDIYYTIYSGSQSTNYNQFTLSTTCADATYTYNATQATAFVLYDLPTWVTYTYNSGTGIITFTVDTNSLSNVGIYTIQLSGMIDQSFYTLYKNFTLYVNECTITASTINGPYKYVIEQTTMTIPFSAFATTYCESSSSVTYSAQANSTTLPSFITLSGSNLNFQVYSTSTLDVDYYSIVLEGSITSYGTTYTASATYFILQVKNKNKGPPQISTILPDITVPANTVAKYNLPTITDPDDDTYTISNTLGSASPFTKYSSESYTISPKSSTINGKYPVTITITDNNAMPESSSYTFNIIVTGGTDLTTNTNTTKNNTTKTPTKAGYTDYVSTTLTAKIKSISKTGEAVVQFSQEIFVPSNYSLWEYFNSSVLKFTIIPSESSDQNNLNFTWNCTQFTSTLMTIQLNFTSPTKISQIEKDYLQVQFLYNGLFMMRENSRAIKYQYSTNKKAIPKQLSASQAALAEAGKTASSSMQGVMMGNFAINLVIRYVVNNLGSLFYYSLGILVTIVVVLAIHFIAKKVKWINKIYQFVSNIIFFNLILRFLLEGYLEFTIDVLINMYYLNWSSRSYVISSLYAIFFAFLTVIFPIGIIVILQIFQKKLPTDQARKRIGSVYDLLKTGSRPALLYNSFFLLRRLWFALIVVCFTGQPSIQITMMLYQCVLLIIYIIYFKPFVMSEFNYIEIFNEATILIVAYHLVLLSQYQPDIDIQDKVGISMIGFTILNIVTNMMLMIYKTFLKVKRIIKMICTKLKTKYDMIVVKKRMKKYNINEKDLKQYYQQTHAGHIYDKEAIEIGHNYAYNSNSNSNPYNSLNNNFVQNTNDQGYLSRNDGLDSSSYSIKETQKFKNYPLSLPPTFRNFNLSPTNRNQASRLPEEIKEDESDDSQSQQTDSIDISPIQRDKLKVDFLNNDKSIGELDDNESLNDDTITQPQNIRFYNKNLMSELPPAPATFQIASANYALPEIQDQYAGMSYQFNDRDYGHYHDYRSNQRLFEGSGTQYHMIKKNEYQKEINEDEDFQNMGNILNRIMNKY